MNRQILLVLTLTVVAVGVCFAAAQTETTEAAKGYLDNLNPPGVLPVVKEKVTLRALASVDPIIEDIYTNWCTQLMEERTNVHLEWQNIAGRDSAQKASIILASGTDLPDVVISAGLSSLQQARFGAQGVFVPLEGYIEEYGSWIKKVAAEQPRFLSELTAADGHLYGIGTLEMGHHGEYRYKMWMNGTWLERLGLAAPETTEEFYQVLKAFKERDPNQNGLSDEIPLSGSVTGWSTDMSVFLMNPFIYNDGDGRFDVTGGKVKAAFVQPEWREGLAYMHRLTKEGLLDPECFVQDRSGIKQLVMGDAVRLGAFPSGVPGLVAPNASMQTREYTTIKPLVGPSGARRTYYFPKPVGAGLAFNVTNACEQPEVAVRWVDYMQSHEAYLAIFYGEDGVDYREAKPGEISIGGEQALYYNIDPQWAKPQQNKIWFHTVPFFCSREVFLGRAVGDDPWFMAARLERETVANYVGHEPKEYLPVLAYDLSVVDEYAELKATIGDYVNQAIARFTVGDLDLQTDWDRYLQDLEAMNLERYVEIVQGAYDNWKKMNQ